MNNSIWHDIAVSSPIVTLAIGGIVLMVLEATLRSAWPKAGFAAFFLFAAFSSCLYYAPHYSLGGMLFQGVLIADLFGLFLFGVIILGTLLAILLGLNRLKGEGIEASGEYYALLLFASCGAMIFVASNELITLFLALETMSMALYCLCGSSLQSKRGAESALKYFLLGSFSSAFLLYGIAILYGLTGSTYLPEIASKLASVDQTMALVAIGLSLVGLGFKIGAVPFHFWAPDVYEGAPTPVTAYMACVVKAAAIGVFVRIFWSGFGGLMPYWDGAVWYLAVMTMTVGNLLALRQRSLKRMLAFSSIAHAGYITIALLLPAEEYGGGAAILYYLVVYTLMTMGAFAVVLAATARFSGTATPDDLTRLNGLGYRAPFLAVMMSLFMLALAGLPPGIAGLFGKLYIFSAAVKAEYIGIVVIGVLNSAVSLAYYLRVIVAMYFLDSEDAEEGSPATDFALRWVVLLCAVGVMALGIFPSLIYDPAVVAAQSVSFR